MARKPSVVVNSHFIEGVETRIDREYRYVLSWASIKSTCVLPLNERSRLPILPPLRRMLWRRATAETRTAVGMLAPDNIDAVLNGSVPSGLIRDWLGAGFVPGVKIEDNLQVVRDYDRYEDVYHPGVIDSAFAVPTECRIFSCALQIASVVAKTLSIPKVWRPKFA
jgi:hypothetical protein